MKNWFTPTVLLLLFSFLIFSSCKRINESTSLGDDVIPGVDGVTTFDTTLEVEAYNGLFTGITDSLGIGRNDLHLLGNIQNDPLFGKTNAKLFLELKPPYYKFTFANKPDSLHLDSVVLVLGWKGTYGDTNTMQRVRVYEMDLLNDFRPDSFYQIREQSFTYSSLLGTKDFFPYELNDSIKVFQDSASNQLRIKLNNSFGNRLLAYDSTNAYATDSAFETYFRGFAIEADASMGNALMAFNLNNEPSTKLAIYYRYDNKGQMDTTVNYFTFTGSAAHHTYIQRDYSGAPILAAQGGTSPDDLIYLQNAPGSYATLKIPGIKNLTNRIIHRAELLVEQVYDVSDKTFTTPQSLYLDVYDSTISGYKCIPYDFVPDQQGLNQINFGMFGRNLTDGTGNPIRKWSFNITRYIQNILTKKEPAEDDFRLVTHRYIFDQIKTNNYANTGSFTTHRVDINSLLGFGRVRVGGGNHPTQKMKVRIVYTKI